MVSFLAKKDGQKRVLREWGFGFGLFPIWSVLDVPIYHFSDADKDVAVVILDVEDYVKEEERQLNKKENYSKINYDPTTANKETIHKFLSRFQKENLLSKNICEELETENPKTSHFFTWSQKYIKGVIQGDPW